MNEFFHEWYWMESRENVPDESFRMSWGTAKHVKQSETVPPNMIMQTLFSY